MARVETPTSQGDVTLNSAENASARSESPLTPGESDSAVESTRSGTQPGAEAPQSSLDRALDQASGTSGGDAGPLLPDEAIVQEDEFQPLDPRDVNPNGAPTIVEAFDATSGEQIQLSDLAYMYDAEFVRQGSDLLLILDDGTAVLIENYFAVEFPPDIHGAFGRILTSDLVESFLRPLAPGQTASLSDNQVAQAQGESIGSVDTLTGEVYAVRPDGTRVLLEAGDPVYQGDQVETADGGNLKITFIDGTIFTLGESARLSLDEMVFDPGSQSGSSAFSILEGGFLFVSGQIAETNPNDMTVTTPVATIGIRGTVVTGEVPGLQTASGETFRFTVVDGEIAVSAGDQTIVLSQNFATASGQADAFGGVQVAQFIETPQNVIARNSAQFRALSPDDLNSIQQAIQNSVQEQTGQTIELDLGSIVEEVTRQEQEEQEEEDQQQEEELEEQTGEEAGEEEASGDEDLSEEELAAVEEEVAEEEELEEEEAEEEEEEAEEEEEESEEEGEEEEFAEEDAFDEFETALGNEGPGSGEDDLELEGGNEGEEEGGEGSDEVEGDGDFIDENDLVGDSEEAPDLEEGGLEDGGDLPGQETGGNQGPNEPTQQGPTQDPDPYKFFTNPDSGFGNSFSDIVVFDDSGTDDFFDFFDGGGNDGGNDSPFDDDDDDVLEDIIDDIIEETNTQVVGIESFSSVNGVLTFDGSNIAKNIIMDLSAQTEALNVTTGSGADEIKTGSGNDTVNSGSGNDIIIGGTGNGDDTYDGGADDDTLLYESVTGTLTVDLSATIAAVDGTSTITDNGGGVIDTDTVTNIENIELGDGNDSVTINAVGVNVDGDVGTDTLDFSNLTDGVTLSLASGVGSSGTVDVDYANFENVTGGSGDDAFTLSNLSQEASGGSGTDTVSLADFGDGLTITSGDGLLIAASGTLSNTYSGFEAIEGGSGDDSVTLSLSSFGAHGGGGNDTFVAVNAIGQVPRGGESATLSFAADGNISGFETLDLSFLSGNDALSLAISADAILSTTESGTVTILGGSDNVIFTSDGWTFTDSISGVGNLYTVNSGAGLILSDALASSAESTFKTFDGSADSLWSNQDNWTTPFSAGSSAPLPKDGDNVVLSSGVDVEFDVNGSLSLGTLTGSDQLQIRSGGTLDISESISLSDKLIIDDGGSFGVANGGSVATLDLEGGVLSIESGALFVDDILFESATGSFSNIINGSGTLNYTGAAGFDRETGTLLLNATFLNSGGVLDLKSGDNVTGTGTIINDATLRAEDDAQVSIGVAVENRGTFDLSGANTVGGEGKGSTLDLSNTLTNTGTLDLGTDAGDIEFNGSGVLVMGVGGEFIGSGATLDFKESAQFNIADGVSYDHTGSGSSPELSFVGNAALGGQGTFTNTTLMDNTAITVTVDRFLNSGTFTGNNIHVNGGLFVNSGTLQVDDGSVFEIAGGTVDTSSGSLEFTGSTAQDIDINSTGRLIFGQGTSFAGTSISNLSLDVNSGGALEIAAGGTVNIANMGPEARFFDGAALDVNGVWRNTGNFTAFDGNESIAISGSGTIINTGTIGFDEETLDVFVVNEALIEDIGDVGVEQIIDNGTIHIGSGDSLTLDGTISGGVVVLDANAVLDGTGTVLDANLVNVSGGAQIGVSNFSADTLAISNTVDVTGSLNLSDTAIEYNASSLSVIEVENGATLALGTDTGFNNPGQGSILVKSGGAIEVDSGETLNLGEFTPGGSNGSLDFEGDNSHLIVNGTVRNTAVGTETFQGFIAGPTTTISGTGTFINSGTLDLAGENFLVGLENQGTLTVRSGDTNEAATPISAFSGGFDNSGDLNINGEATLSVSQNWDNTGSVELADNGKLTGLGTLVNQGTVSLAGTDSELAGFVDNDGVIEGSGLLTGQIDTVGGTVNISGADIRVESFGTLSMDESSVFSGSGSIAVGTNGVLELAAGSAIELSSDLPNVVFGDGSNLNIDGTATNTAVNSDFGDSTLSVTIGGSGTFTNTGIFTIQNDTISVDTSNGGVIFAAGGANAINGTFENSGAFGVVDNGTVSIGGTLTNSGTMSTSSGGGQKLEGNGVVENDGIIDFEGSTALESVQIDSTDGDISIASGATVTSTGATLTVGGDTDLTGDGALSLTADSRLSLTDGETFTLGGTLGAPSVLVENSTIDGTGVLEVDSTITLSGATIASGATVDNDSAVVVTSDGLTVDGSMDNSSALTVEESGNIDGSGTIILTDSGSITLNGSSTISADISGDSTGTIVVDGTNTQIGSMSGVGSIDVGSGDELAVVDNGSVDVISVLNGEMSVGTIDPGTAAVLDVDTLNISNGTLSGDGTLDVVGTEDAGTITSSQISGNLNIDADVGTFQLVGSISGSGTILNAGVMSGAASLGPGPNGQNGGEDLQFGFLEIAPTLINTGVFSLDSQTFSANDFNNQGTLELNNSNLFGAGTLSLNGGVIVTGDDSNGTAQLTIGSSAAVNVSAGQTFTVDSTSSDVDFTIIAGASFQGDGRFNFNDDLDVTGGVFAGTDMVATETLTNTDTVTVTGVLDLTSGTLNMDAGDTLIVASGGRVIVGSDTDLDTDSNFGTVLFQDGATLQVASGQTYTVDADDAGVLSFADGATVDIDGEWNNTVDASSLFNASGSVALTGDGSIVNTGTLEFESDQIGIAITNTGNVIFESGTLPVTVNAEISTGTSGVVTVESGGTLTGSGTLTAGADADLELSGSNSLAVEIALADTEADLVVSGSNNTVGVVSGSGDINLTSSSAAVGLAFTVGQTLAADFQIGSGESFNDVAISAEAGTLVLSGDLTTLDSHTGTLLMSGNIDNRGTMSIQNPGGAKLGVNGDTFTNSGSIDVIGAAGTVTTVSLFDDAAGQFNFTGDQISIDANSALEINSSGSSFNWDGGSLASAGRIELEGGATLAANSGSLGSVGGVIDVGAGGILGGSGTLISTGTIDYSAGAGQITGVLDLKDGTLNADGASDTLTVASGGKIIVGADTDLGTIGTLDIDGTSTIAIAAGETFEKDGTETETTDVAVNSTTTGDQEATDVAKLSDGNYATVWMSEDTKVYTRVFDAAGNAVSDELLLDTRSTPPIPRVAEIASGGYIVGYTQDSIMKYALFNNDGSTIGFFHELLGGPYQNYDVFGWGSNGYGYATQASGSNNIDVRFHGTGAHASTVSFSPGTLASDIRVEAVDSDTVVLTYLENTGGSNHTVQARFINPTNGVTEQSASIESITGNVDGIDVAVLTGGNIVVTWSVDSGVFAEIVDSTGTTVVDAFQVDGSASAVAPSVVALADGGFQIFHTMATIGQGTDIYAVTYNSSGAVTTASEIVASNVTNAQAGVSAAPGANAGEAVFVYESPDVDGSGVFFGNTGATELDVELAVGATLDGPGTFVNSDATEVLDLNGNTLGASVTFDNDATVSISSNGVEILGKFDNDGGTVIVGSGATATIAPEDSGNQTIGGLIDIGDGGIIAGDTLVSTGTIDITSGGGTLSGVQVDMTSATLTADSATDSLVVTNSGELVVSDSTSIGTLGTISIDGTSTLSVGEGETLSFTAPTGDDAGVGTQTFHAQGLFRDPDIAVLSNGNVVTAWEFENPVGTINVYYSVFDPDAGTSVVTPSFLDSGTLTNDGSPSVAVDPDGGFRIAYHLSGAARLQDFNDDGTTNGSPSNFLGGPTFVTTDSAYSSDGSWLHVSVNEFTSGELNFAYKTPAGANQAINGGVPFDISGAPVGEISVTALADGDFAYVLRHDDGGTGTISYGFVDGSAGTATRVDVTSFSNTTNAVSESPVVTALTDGTVVIAYKLNENIQLIRSSDPANFSSNTVNTTARDIPADARIHLEATSDGGFVLSWSESNGTDNDVYAQKFTSALTTDSDVFNLTESPGTETIGGTLDQGDAVFAMVDDNDAFAAFITDTSTDQLTLTPVGFESEVTPGINIDLQQNATIGGSGTFKNNGSFEFDGNTLGASATLDNDGTISITANGFEILGTFDNSDGTLTVADNGTLTLSSGGTTTLDGQITIGDGIEIAGSSTLDVLEITGALSANNSTDSGEISANLVVGSTGSVIVGGEGGSDGTLILSGDVTNNGFIQVDPANINENGVLKISGDFTNDATLQVDNAATLIVGDGSGTMTNAGTLQGLAHEVDEVAVIQAGKIINTGIVSAPGSEEAGFSSLSFQDLVFDNTGGTIEIDADTDITFAGSALQLATGSTLDFNTGSSIIISGTDSALDLTEAALTITNTAGQYELATGASVSGPGTFVNQTLMTLDGVTVAAGGTFENDDSSPAGVGVISVSANETLTVDGALTSDSAASMTVGDGGVLAGTGSVTNESELEATGVTIGSSLTYTGDIGLDTTGSVTINGTLDGDLTLRSAGGASIHGAGDINLGDITFNGGSTLGVSNATVTQTGTATLDSASDTISLAGSEWVLGAGADFADTNGTMLVSGGSTLSVAAGATFNYDSTNMLALRIGSGSVDGFIGGNGTFANIAGSSISLNDDASVTIASFDNQGGLEAIGANLTFSNTALTNGGTITATADGSDASIDFLLGGSIGGVLILDHGTGASLANTDADLVVSDGTLTIAGELHTTDSEGSGAANEHDIHGNVLVTGTVTADARLNVATDGVLDARDANLTINSGGGLEVGGTLIVGTDTNLTGSGPGIGEIEIKDDGVLQIAAGEVFTLTGSSSASTNTVLDASGTDPEVAVLQNGNVVAVWEDGSDISGKVVNPDTGATVQSFTIAANVGGGDAVGDPAVETMSDGTFRVVYAFNDSSGGEVGKVGTSLFNEDGSANTAHSQLSVSSSNTNDIVGVVAMSNGEFGVAVDKISQTNIVYYDSNGTALSGNNLGATGSVTGKNGIGSNGTDEFIVARMMDSGGTTQINIVAYDSSGQTKNAIVATDTTGTYGNEVDVTFLSNGHYVVAYIKNDQPAFQVLNASHDNVTAETIIETTMTAGGSISVEPGTSATFRVTWTADNGGDTDVFSQLFSGNGNAAASIETITANSVANTDVEGAIFTDNSGISVFEQDGAIVLGDGNTASSTGVSIDLLDGSTISGTGDLRNENEINSGGSVELTSGATLTNTGDFTHTGGDFLVNGSLDNTSTGTIDVVGGSLTAAGLITNSGTISLIGNANSSALVLNTDMTNAGYLELNDTTSDGTGGATIVSASSTLTLTNSGTIAIHDGGGNQAHLINANLTNAGTMSLIGDAVAEFQASGAGGTLTFDTSDGGIFINNDASFTMHDGTMQVGSDTAITGGGTLHISEDSHLIVADGEKFTFDSASGSFALAFAANERTTVGGSGTFAIASGSTLTTGGAEIRMNGGHYDNDGKLQVNSGGIVTLNTSDFDNTNGEIELVSGSAEAELFIDGDRTLGGLIDMNDDGSDGAGSTLTVFDDGTLTLTGNLRSTFSDSLSVAHKIDGDVVNQGTVTVDHKLDITAASVLDSSDGTISLVNSSAAHTLDVNGTLLIGADTHFGGPGTLDIDGSMAVVAGETFTWDDQVAIDMNSGTIAGTGEFDIAAGATLAVHDTVLKAAAIDVNGTMVVQTRTTTISTTGLDNTGGVLKLRDSAGSTVGLLLEQDFTNSGDLWLTGGAAASGATIDHANEGSQSLTNAGTITVENEIGSGGAKQFNLDVVNTGTFHVSADTTIGGSHDLDSSGGSLFVGSGVKLSVAGGDLTVDGSTTRSGSGTIEVIGGSLDVASGAFSVSSGEVLIQDGSLTGTGTMNVENGGSLFLSDTDSSLNELTNLGQILIEGDVDLTTTDLSNERDTGGEGVVNGTVSLIGGETGATLTVGGSFENSGVMQMGTSATTTGATLVSTGTVTNSGTIEVIGTGGNRVFDTDLANTGTIDVDRGATLATGHALDLNTGKIDIASGQVLVLNGTMDGGNDAIFTGTGAIGNSASGQVGVNSGETLDFDTVAINAAAGAQFTGNGTLRLGATSNTIAGATVAVTTLDNDGTTSIQDGVSKFSATTLTGDGVLEIESSASGSAVMQLTSDLTNAAGHTIQFSNASSGGTMTAINGATLTNAGVLETQSFGGSDQHELQLDIINSGTLDLDGDARLGSGQTLNSIDGTIDIASGQVFSLNGILETGTDTTVKGDGTLVVGNGAHLNLTSGETFIFGDTTLAVGAGATTVASGGANQNGSQVIQLSTGDYWVSFVDDNDDYLFQRFDSEGTAQGGAITVDDNATSTPEYSVAVTSDDNVIFWIREEDEGGSILRQVGFDSEGTTTGVSGFPSGGDGTGAGVFDIGTYESNGAPGYIGSFVSNGKLVIQEHETSGGLFGFRNVETSFTTIDETHITGLQNGSTDVVHAYIKDGDLVVRTYQDDLTDSTLNSTILGVSSSNGISLAALTGGGFAVSYAIDSEIGESKVALYDASQSLVTTITLGSIFSFAKPEVTALSDGNFAVLYQAGSGDVEVRVYDTSGNQVGTTLTVVESGIGSLSDFAVVADDDGGYAVSYSDNSTQTDNVFLKFVSGQKADFEVEFDAGGTISGAGTLGIDTAQNIDLTGALLQTGANIDNDGTISVLSGTLTLESTSLDNTGGLVKVLTDSADASVEINGAITNAGTFQFDASSNEATLVDISSGGDATVTNTGTMIFTGGDGAGTTLQSKIDTDVVNTGTITVDGFTKLSVGHVLDTTDGKLNVTPAGGGGEERLALQNGSTLSVGTDTDLTGTGTIRTTNGSTINVNNDENFVYVDGDADFAFGGDSTPANNVAIHGGGTFTNQSTLELSSEVTLSIGDLINDGGAITMRSDTAASSLNFAGVTLTNQNGGTIEAATLSGTGELHNEAGTIALDMGGKLVTGDVDVLNEGAMKLDASETLTVDGSGGASFSLGTNGSFTANEGSVLRLNNAAVFTNGGLIALVASGATPALALEQDTGVGTLINTGTIDFSSTLTTLELASNTTLSLQSGTSFTGAAGAVDLRADAELAFDHDYTWTGTDFTADTTGIEFGHAVIAGTGTVTNTGGLADIQDFKLDGAAFVNQANLALDNGTISTVFTNAAGSQNVSLTTSGTLTLDDTLTNLGTLTMTGGTIAGGGTLDNQGNIDFSASVDTVANFSAITFKNSGVITLSSVDSAGNGTLQTGDFTNTGTITFDPSSGGDGMTMRLGASGDGTLTNAGLISTELAVDKVTTDLFLIQGTVVADATEGGTIHISDYVVSGQEVGSIKISQDLVLNEHSKVIIDSGDGIANIGAVLDVSGDISYAGTFELRVRDGFKAAFDAVQANTSSGKIHRIDILDENGSADFAGTTLNKLVIPDFNGTDFSLGLTSATEIADQVGDVLNGVSSGDALLGSVGDDVFDTGTGGTDSLFGLAGNDSFTLSTGATIAFLDGGTGNDVFHSAQLDFGQGDIWKFNNLEAIDFNSASTGTISMNEDFIFGASEDLNGLISGLGVVDSLKEDALIIAGKSGQTLDLTSGSFTAAGVTVSVDHDGDSTDDSYSIYTASNGANVYVDTDMSVNV